MSYPGEERVKNLQERLNQLEGQVYSAHSIEDKIFHGVIKEVVVGDYCDKGYLKVCPLPPTVSQDGDLTFVTGEKHPLQGIDGDTRYDKIFVVNIPREFLEVYYRPGDVVKYWHYSGTLDDAEKIRGSYITVREDLRFDCKVWFECPPCNESSSSQSDSCTKQPVPSPSIVAFKYKGQPLKYNSSAVNLVNKFELYQCSTGGNPIIFDCWNKAELLNVVGGGENPTGTGAIVDDSGIRMDTLEPSKLIPIGPTVVSMRPYVIPNGDICPLFSEFYFDAIPNEFADYGHVCDNCNSSSSSSTSSSTSRSTSSSSSSSSPSSVSDLSSQSSPSSAVDSSSQNSSSSSSSQNSSSSSSGDEPQCYYLFQTDYDCATNTWSNVILVDCHCGNDFGHVPNVWFRNGEFSGCRYQYIKRGQACAATITGCVFPPNPIDVPTYPDHPESHSDCVCDSSSSSSQNSSSSSSNSCTTSIPPCPEVDGTYVLTATVSGGRCCYAWVSTGVC